jgi:hypothetical protein
MSGIYVRGLRKASPGRGGLLRGGKDIHFLFFSFFSPPCVGIVVCVAEVRHAEQM